MANQSASIKILQASYSLTALLTASFFAQSDLSHTVFSSYALLQGRFFDFYDFNQLDMVGNDYLILLYAAVAIWMAPIYFLGFATPQEQFNLLLANSSELIWAKLGLAILFVVLATRIQKIASNYFDDKGQSRVRWLVLTSPFALLPVFVMGQYDIVGLLLVVLGFEAWLAKRFSSFVIFFAFAFSFKYLAIAVFVPLALIGAKNFRQAISWGGLALIPIGMQIGLGLTNAAYRSNALSQPMKLLLPDLGSPIAISLRVFALLAAIGIALWLLRKGYNSDFDQRQFAVIAVVASLTILFTAVRWNPQWLIYLVPFWALLALQIRHNRLQMIAESLGFIGLVWMLANPWMNNVDDSMALRGAFSKQLPDRALRLNDFYVPEFLALGVILTHLAIIAPLAIRGWEMFVDRKNNQEADNKPRPLGKTWLLRPISFLFAFIIPVSLCYFIPPVIASAVSTNVEVNALNRITFGQLHRKKIEFGPGETLSESLVAPDARPRAIELHVTTIGQRVSGPVFLEILEGKSLVASSTASLVEAKDSSFPGFSGWLPIVFKFSEDLDLRDRSVELKFTNRTGSAMAIWVDDVRPESVDIKLQSGEVTSGSIVMTFLEPRAERRGN